MGAITTHVLDTSRGRPAEGVPVRLEARDGVGAWSLVGSGRTDADGRLKTLTEDFALVAGVYRLTFETASYFDERGAEGFYPEVSVVFRVREAGGHYHVPLLLSPYGYSTYRGS